MLILLIQDIIVISPGLNKTDALQYACSRRPLIDPVGDFPHLLNLCDKLPRAQDKKFLI